VSLRGDNSVNNPWVVTIVGGVIVGLVVPWLAKILDPRSPFWKKPWLPWLGPVFGLAVAVIGISIWPAVRGIGHPAPHPSPSNSSAVVLRSSPATAISSRPTSATLGSPPAVWWQGRITITWPGIQLDAKHPSESQSYCTFFLVADYLHPCGNSLFAAWTESSAPTPAQCHDWAQSNSVTQLQLTSGMQLCVITDMQRPAYVNITSVSSDGSTAEANVIVWNS
jgi:hypothetical protein